MVPIVEKEETESLAEEVFEKVFNILDYDGGGDITVGLKGFVGDRQLVCNVAHGLRDSCLCNFDI